MFDMFQEYSGAEQESPTSNAPLGDVFVISIGGSLLVKAKPDIPKIKEIADAISSLHSSGKKIVLVVGGGNPARNYVEVLEFFEANNFQKDLMGIQLTRANALMIANAIPEAHHEVQTEITKAKEILDAGKIPVYGGIIPFFTTDAVAALLAENLKATFVNLTNVDGIYEADPNDYPDAKRFEEISYQKLISLILKEGSSPGQNVVLDLPCCLILERSKIQGVVLNGNDIPNFSSYVNGLSFTGTAIKETESEETLSDSETPLVKRKRKKKKKPAAKKRGSYEEPDPKDIDF